MEHYVTGQVKVLAEIDGLTIGFAGKKHPITEALAEKGAQKKDWITANMFGISYWVIPIFSAAVWLAMLGAMLGKWRADGSPHYPSMDADQRIAYISDVGANPPAPLLKSGLQPLFIAMSAVSVVTLDLAFFADRWLRHRRRLAPNTSVSEKVLSILASIFAVAGAAGIILLSIFDTYNHPRLHDGFLLLFIGGYIISAIFVCAEYQRLGIHQRQHRILRASFWLKLAFIIIEAALAIAFAVINFRGNPNTAAVLEWVVALIFTGWILSFAVDLWPALHTGSHHGGGKFDHPHEDGAAGFAGTNGAINDQNYNARYSGATLEAEQPQVAQPQYHGDGSRGNYGYRGAGNGRVSPGPATTMSSTTTTTWVDQRDGRHHTSTALNPGTAY